MNWMETTKQDLLLEELQRIRSRLMIVEFVLMIVLMLYGMVITAILLLK